jgi:6-phosphofructokinase 2
MPAIVTITFNPAIDVSTSTDRVEPDRKLRCTGQKRDPGGGGINVARVVRRLGGEVLAIYPAGGLTGQLLRQLMDREGVPSKTIDTLEETREDFTVTDESVQRQYRFVLSGPRLRDDEWQACLDALRAVRPAPRYVVASGSLPPGAPTDLYARVAVIARDLGAKLLFDSSGSSLSEALKVGAYLIKPNLRELGELSGEDLSDERAWMSAARAQVRSGRLDVVALSLGHLGALLVTRDVALRARALPIKFVSTVGAGDSFLGALVHALAAGEDLIDAFRLAVAAGSAAVLSTGTELCEPSKVALLKDQVVIESV